MSATAGGSRLARLAARIGQLGLDFALVRNEANVRALTGVACDNACLAVSAAGEVVLHTDFRYVPMVHRVAPGLEVRDLKELKAIVRRFRPVRRRIGCEGSMPHLSWLKLAATFPKHELVEFEREVLSLRAVKTPEEIARVRAAVRLNDSIWARASAGFRAGMTERELARLIRRLMIDEGEGEAFETIVCVGANAAECHHVPDDTVWNGRESLLVDMGVKLGGFCSDMTRVTRPARASRLWRQVYELVLRANRAGVAACRPGMTAGELDRVAREVIEQGGFGECFGHSLGHGVGLEIHEAPTARQGDRTVLEPGMLVTIEPGIYLEGNLGVRIEDLVLVTEDGCEVLSQSAR